MNTRITPPNQSRQTSVIPHVHHLQRNGHVTQGTSSSICTLVQRASHVLTKNDSTDTLEMQTLANQRQTMEAFDELEHLVPPGVPTRAFIIELNSFLQDQDESSIEPTIANQSGWSSS